MPNRNNRRRGNFRRGRNNNNRRSNRAVDPIMGPKRHPTTAVMIPRHTVNPLVTRVVRISRMFAMLTTTFSIKYTDIATQDAIDYIGDGPPPRYGSMRCMIVRVYMDAPPALIASPARKLEVVDQVSGVTFLSEPVAGSTCASIAYTLPFVVRSAIVATSSGEVVFNATLITTVALVTTESINVYMDVVTEFQ